MEWQRTVDPYVRPGMDLLDIGAGTGRFAELFAGRLQARVVAVEPATGMRAQRHATTSATWIAGRAEALPVRAARFDVVWLCCVAHYLDLARAGHEIARVLRPDGCALVRAVFPDRFDDLAWMRWFPAARAIDEQRMPTVERVAEAWANARLRLARRVA